ncbi:dynamin family protein [Vibrio parahaemolyticus]|uniref:dynamin family protein n=2 Tax=Vibrio harveyi group TaxID=717610 RepID=UPI001D87291B|nr:dynamin family protein [Vibrio parahaemolyticus]EJG0716507.1 dynamin family protein [Vibrio parahaemolyticus]EKB1969021.1 dynamin family protein [Vibrio parahaemolyticus]
MIKNKINVIYSKYGPHTRVVDEKILGDISLLRDTFETDIDNAKQENRVLRIGIVGQIKRGKSSFLNSLLFNGKSVLPKAATPMTAALTKISYSEQPSATVEFYSKKEWAKVIEQAHKVEQDEKIYQEQLNEFQASKAPGLKRQRGIRPPQKPNHPEESKACFELYQMVQRSNLDVEKYLDKEEVIKSTGSNETLISDLTPFVGADGKFTPIVKSSSLALNLPELKDIEVVDTPGMNDPIISRGRRTQEFLGQCDVIFLLSYCGQFLDSQDMALLAQNIPNKGIEEIILIGSLFDSALLDEYSNYDSIQQALPSLTASLNAQAQSEVNAVCRQDELNNGGQPHLMQTLQNALPPIFVSSRCYDLAKKGDDLSEEEQHTLNRLNQMFDGFTFTPQILEAVANFKKVHSKLESVRENKDKIMAERLDNLLKGAERDLLQKLTAISDDITLKRNNLQQGDLAEAEKKQKELAERINAGKSKVSMVFDKYRVQIEKELHKAEQSIKQNSLSVKRINSQTGSREESYTTYSEVSDSSWYNPFSWGRTRTVSSTNYRTVNYTYANVQDAVQKLEDFVVETSDRLYQSSSQTININQFREDIKQAVRGLFDFSDPDFDPEMILLPLSNSVDRITIPTISLDLDHHINSIRQQFSANEVEGDEIQQLRAEQARIVGILLTEITQEVSKCGSDMLGKISREEQDFLPTLIEDLESSIEQLRADLENKEQALKEYSDILEMVEEDKRQLSTANLHLPERAAM